MHSQADISLEYDPGDAIQIDWDECTVYLNGIKQSCIVSAGAYVTAVTYLSSCFIRRTLNRF